MRILFRVVLVVFLCSISISSLGQNNEDYFRNVVDSLDKIQAQKFEKIKEKGTPFVIKVKTQQSFDNIKQNIISAIKSGKKNIKVKIYKGLYYFREGHITMSGISIPEVSIRIEGTNAVITSDTEFEKGKGFVSSYEEMTIMDDPVVIIDSVRKLCKIPYRNKFDNNKRSQYSKVQITEWFKAPVYDIDSIDETGIYFFAPDLKIVTIYKRKGYNVNYDCLYIEKTPRFRLYDKTKAPKCEASQFFLLNNCCFRKLSISGLRFISNGFDKALIDINHVDTKQTDVTRCTFEYIRGNVLNVSNSNNVSFNKNTIRNTGGNEVRFINNCPNVRVTNNIFEGCGQSIGNTFCVTCWESDYYIGNNIFCDFGYGAIGVGVWHGYMKAWPSRGIIEHNEIYYTTDYFNNSLKYTLMDSGAIYTWTQNDNVIIRYNYIHDYVGAGNNRGIFCDDGASNLDIYGNIIINTPNCYSIDSRREKDRNPAFKNNDNNFMAYNVVDGKVCFMGYGTNERHNWKGSNFVVNSINSNQLVNKLDGLKINDDDIEVKESDLNTLTAFGCEYTILRLRTEKYNIRK